VTLLSGTDDLCKTVVGPGIRTYPEMPYLRPLAALLGVGLTTLGSALCSRSSQRTDLLGSRVFAGGRSACTAWPTWPLCALVVLAAEMAQAAEGLAFAEKVLARAAERGRDSSAFQAGRPPEVGLPAHAGWMLRRCSPEELDQALRATATVMLTNGWVTDLRDEEGEEV